MPRIITIAIAVATIFVGVQSAPAAITVTHDPLPAGDTLVGQSSPVLFTNYSGSYAALQVDTSLALPDPFGLTASYQTGDLPDSSGFAGLRLVERVANNTVVPWMRFQVAFDNPVMLFVVNQIPETYTITGNVPSFVATIAPSIATLSTTQSTVDFAFTNPILPGESFGMYIAFTPPNSLGDGSAHITQTPNLPEPSTIVLAALGLGALFIARRRVR
jgi:hypothetical protein